MFVSRVAVFLRIPGLKKKSRENYEPCNSGVVFFVSKSLSGIGGQKKLEKFAILTRKPRSHA